MWRGFEVILTSLIFFGRGGVMHRYMGRDWTVLYEKVNGGAGVAEETAVSSNSHLQSDCKVRIEDTTVLTNETLLVRH